VKCRRYYKLITKLVLQCDGLVISIFSYTNASSTNLFLVANYIFKKNHFVYNMDKFVFLQFGLQ